MNYIKFISIIIILLVSIFSYDYLKSVKKLKEIDSKIAISDSIFYFRQKESDSTFNARKVFLLQLAGSIKE